MKIKHGRGYVYCLQYHVVWCVKYRQNILSETISNRLIEVIKDIAISNDFEIDEINTDSDHIHLLISLKPQIIIPNIIKALKGNSARIMFKEFPELKNQLWKGNLWSPSYFISTVSDTSENDIRYYIQSQGKISVKA